MWDEITYPFPNFNRATVEIWGWISNFIAQFMMGVITSPCGPILQSWSCKWLQAWGKRSPMTSVASQISTSQTDNIGVVSQWTNDVLITSSLRQNNVATSFWRIVFITLLLCHVSFGIWLTWWDITNHKMIISMPEMDRDSHCIRVRNVHRIFTDSWGPWHKLTHDYEQDDTEEPIRISIDTQSPFNFTELQGNTMLKKRVIWISRLTGVKMSLNQPPVLNINRWPYCFPCFHGAYGVR